MAPPCIARLATHETARPLTAALECRACVLAWPARTGLAEAGGCPCPPCPPPAAFRAAGSSFTSGQGHPPSSAGDSAGVRRSPCDTAAGQGRRVPSHASKGGGPGGARPGGHGVGGYPPALAPSGLERGSRLATDCIERPHQAASRQRRNGFHLCYRRSSLIDKDVSVPGPGGDSAGGGTTSRRAAARGSPRARPRADWSCGSGRRARRR